MSTVALLYTPSGDITGMSDPKLTESPRRRLGESAAMMDVLWRQIVLRQEGLYAASMAMASQSLQCLSVPFSRRLRLYACS